MTLPDPRLDPAAPPVFVGRGGQKMSWALDHFVLDPAGWTCADLGSHVGGFVDALLQRGAARVYSVDTCYATFAWKLRHDPRVVLFERTNALHVQLPEPVRLLTCDVGWTKQEKILPHALSLLAPDGEILALVKPQYEARREEIVPGKGRVKDSAVARIVADVQALAAGLGEVRGWGETPFAGGKGKNPEFFLRLGKRACP